MSLSVLNSTGPLYVRRPLTPVEIPGTKKFLGSGPEQAKTTLQEPKWLGSSHNSKCCTSPHFLQDIELPFSPGKLSILDASVSMVVLAHVIEP